MRSKVFWLYDRWFFYRHFVGGGSSRRSSSSSSSNSGYLQLVKRFANTL
jgi:hypothetical protein